MERCDCGGELIPLGAHSRCRDCGLQVETQDDDTGFKNLQGDGPSGFDYWQDTKRCP